MTQEDIQLLLIDLCARLPYRVIVQYKGHNTIIKNKLLTGSDLDCNMEYYKPYLRPMSSMTKEELKDFAKIKFEDDAIWKIVEFPKIKYYKGFINVKCKNKNNGDTWTFQVNTRTPLETYYGIDWLNAHHFDYRGLIKKGLALEAPDNMYKSK